MIGAAARVLLPDNDAAARPFANADAARSWITRGIWPCRWVLAGGETGEETPGYAVFRCRFTTGAAGSDGPVRVHVAASDTYALYLDGAEIGRGSERGEPSSWPFDSYDLWLAPGASYRLEALVACLGPGRAARWQLSALPRPALLIAPESEEAQTLWGTGTAMWEVRSLPGASFAPPFPHDRYSIGPNIALDAARFVPPGSSGGAGDEGEWRTAEMGPWGSDARERTRVGPETPLLRPALLPPKRREKRMNLRVRYAAVAGEANAAEPFGPDTPRRVPAVLNDAVLQAAYQRFLNDANPPALCVPPGVTHRVLVDLDEYVCGDVTIRLRGGENGSVRALWAESLFEDAEAERKGDRGAVDNKFFVGVGDTIHACPETAALTVPPLAVRAGRYIEITATAAPDAPLYLEAVTVTETRYPLPREAAGSVRTPNEPRLAPLLALCRRTLAVSCQDALTDGPYYEQMLWLGDAVQQALTVMTTWGDTRLVRQALHLFDHSRLASGLTRARWPARDTLVIAPYSLLYVTLLSEYARWGVVGRTHEPEIVAEHRAFVAERMRAARAILDGIAAFVGADGVLGAAPGWNFLDWATGAGWRDGVPPGGDRGPSCALHFLYVKALREAAQLEEWLGDRKRAAWYERTARTLTRRGDTAFWDDARGLFRDTPTGSGEPATFSEHAQTLALLSGAVGGDDRRRGLLADALANSAVSPKTEGDDLTRAAWAFTHYVFEAYHALGLGEAFGARLEPWFALQTLGMKTTPERPEPTRSDCHGWSAHPAYHAAATLAGVRPRLGGAFFDIAPLAARLPANSALGMVEATLPRVGGDNDNGEIAVGAAFELAGQGAARVLRAAITLPQGTRGVLRLPGVGGDATGGETCALCGGEQTVVLPAPDLSG